MYKKERKDRMNNISGDRINTQRATLDYTAPLDHGLMMRYLDIMCQRYSFLSVSYIGESILGKGIPIITLGEGEKTLMYVSAHSAKDWIGSILLLRFINEYCETYKNGGRLFNYSIGYLFSTRRLCIVPMLNPDGVDININGVSDDNILRERLLTMNGGEDFSEWTANARGVALSCNYRAGFAEYKNEAASLGIVSGGARGYCGEMPESEPETSALCRYIRYNSKLCATLELQSFGERIFYRVGDRVPPRARIIGDKLSHMSGYRAQSEREIVAHGGFFGWCVDEFNVPSFSILYGNDKEQNNVSEYFNIYARLREVLFTLPALI